MNEFFYTVYQTKNLTNDKIYIGVHKTKNPNDVYLGSGIYLKEAIQKYGKQNFKKEILFIFLTPEEAYTKEKELVNDEFIIRSDTYNIANGGNPSPDWTEERKFFFREWLKGENHPMYGKTNSEESNIKRANSLKGKKRSPEAIHKARQTRIENKIPSHWKDKEQSIESNLKRSETHKNLEKIECPHCKKIISPQNASRWHFNKCKLFS